MLLKDNTKANYISVLKFQKEAPKDKMDANQGKIILCLSPQSVPDVAALLRRVLQWLA